MGRMLFYNGTVLTMEEELLAEAVLVEDGIIAGVGSYDGLCGKLSDQDERIDLEGKTLMPAFIDPHSHFSVYAGSLLQASLEETVTCGEIQERIKTFIERNQVPKGQWVVARGYDHNTLEEKTHPRKEVLDEAAPDHPVLIQHKSGHMGVFNSMALKLLGVTEKTPVPAGGSIGVDGGGLTGYMEEAAYMKYLKEIPQPSGEKLLEAYEKTQSVYASHGITTLQEGMMVDQMVPMYQSLLQSGILKLDVVGYVDVNSEGALLQAFEEHGKRYRGHFKIGGYKIFLDGSPQGRTAWMRTPYVGDGTYCGYGTMTDEAVCGAVERSVKEGYQLLAHCNGDAACEQYLRAWEAAAAKGEMDKTERPVMVHAQLVGVDQLPRLKKLKMIPSFFAAHVYHWGDVHIANFGKERAAAISPAASALKEGILFTFHQDAPVIEPDMLETVWCAVNRRTKNHVLLGEGERIPVLEALKAVTIHGAYQYFEEHEKGSIRAGKRADLVVLDQNPLEVEPDGLRAIQVLQTYKDGVKVFDRDGEAV